MISYALYALYGECCCMTSLKHWINRRNPLHGEFQLDQLRSIFIISHVGMFHWRMQHPLAFRENYTSLWCLCNLLIIDVINERQWDTFSSCFSKESQLVHHFKKTFILQNNLKNVKALTEKANYDLNKKLKVLLRNSSIVSTVK